MYRWNSTSLVGYIAFSSNKWAAKIPFIAKYYSLIRFISFIAIISIDEVDKLHMKLTNLTKR